MKCFNYFIIIIIIIFNLVVLQCPSVLIRSESVTASQTSYAKLFTLMFDDLRNYMYNENNL